MFFIAEEYIKFIYNLKYYIESDIEFIEIEDSKYSDYLKKIQYPGLIAKIKDIEICFLHYSSKEEAIKKWNRRKARINWDNIVYKFNDQNLCSYSHLKKFMEFKANKKICFTSKKYAELDTVQIKKYERYEYVLDDIKSYKKYIDIYRFLND